MQESVFLALAVLHVLAALVGFGSLGLAGTYAAKAARLAQVRIGEGIVPDELARDTEELTRYFCKPASLWWVLLAVPWLGLGALAADPHGGGLSQAWVLAALGVWVAAAATAAALVMPALRTVRSLVLHEAARAVPADRPALARAGQRANRWALVCDLAFLCALALMVWRP